MKHSQIKCAILLSYFLEFILPYDLNFKTFLKNSQKYYSFEIVLSVDSAENLHWIWFYKILMVYIFCKIKPITKSIGKVLENMDSLPKSDTVQSGRYICTVSHPVVLKKRKIFDHSGPKSLESFPLSVKSNQ